MLAAPISLPTVLAGAAIIFLFALALYPSSLLRWFQRKRYQYEVTFSLYMLTPTEKFIFNEPFANPVAILDSILFLFLSMVTIAVALYLPRHVSIIAHRAYYYLSGDLLKNGTTSEVLGTTADILTPTIVAEAAGSA
ncbi:hypothetical protein E4T52_14690 [Aureobasidium sp. EXF-3400]|nr:hypothetical protein E4T51_13729 [Aureobasidium sp. EXF-12344]KAI4770295.1 hypothetical protein E4T52_14690 [Aureobasidium sp. EXF-3400]